MTFKPFEIKMTEQQVIDGLKSNYGNEFTTQRTEFEFTHEMHRLLSDMNGWPPMSASGILEVTARIRAAGSDDPWISQSYPISVLFEQVPESDAAEVAEMA